MEHIHALPDELKTKVEGGRGYTKTEKDFFPNSGTAMDLLKYALIILLIDISP